MPAQEVLLDVDGHVARITLNRPEVLNAENLAWVHGLEAAVDAAAADPDVRVVVVAGSGRAFCAGMDLDMLSSKGMPAGFYRGQERAFRQLETMDKITIAVVHGYCIGGGLQLAIACDLRICSSDAQLGVPALKEAIFPGMSVFRLPRLIGLGPARRLILGGEVIDADAAFDLGLVDHLVPAERFSHGVTELVDRYLSVPATAAGAAKQLMATAFTATFDEAFAASEPLLRECLESQELADAMGAWRARNDG